jgi:predicted  nucleic acid-binding Zn-ribbon protein
MKKFFLSAVPILLAVFFLSSCATTDSVSTESFQEYVQSSEEANNLQYSELKTEIDRLKSDVQNLEVLKANIEELSRQMGTFENNLDNFESKYAKQEDIRTLRSDSEVLSKNFNSMNKAIEDLMNYAGYNSTDELLQLGRDIVNVNTNIKDLNKKIEKLRSAMSLFVLEE